MTKDLVFRGSVDLPMENFVVLPNVFACICWKWTFGKMICAKNRFVIPLKCRI